MKRTVKSLTRSDYQELVLSWKRILNHECVLNPLEIVKDFLFNHPTPSPRSRTEQNDLKKVGMCPALFVKHILMDWESHF